VSSQDHLEIIRANEAIEFYPLDPYKGITNIGQHSENDIVLHSPGVALFHAVLDHRQKPYQFVLMSQDGRTSVSGELVAPNLPTFLQNWDRIEIDGHTLILVESDGVGAYAPPVQPPARATAPLPFTPAVAAPPMTRPEPFSSGYVADYAPPLLVPVPQSSGTRFVALPPSQEDDLIMVEFLTREATIDVEQVATYEVTIINGGDIVAMFMVHVQGLDGSWVEVSQPYVNLYEGDRTTVKISVYPPRQPTSRAGSHYFAIQVTSPNYPGRMNQQGATLTITPYYEFTVGELAPRQQSISWFKHFGKTILPIVNNSNCSALFQIEAADDERACNFEFHVPGENIDLARQAELNLASTETAYIPIRITPHSRQLFALRKRTYSFTVTTNLFQGAQMPRSMLGQLSQSSLFGLLHVLLAALIMLILLVVIFRPYITTFNVDGSTTKVIAAGEPVTLIWNASPFANLTIPQFTPPQLDSSQGQATVIPTANVVYELRAENFLSRLSPRILGADPVQVSVMVTPIPPEIKVFGGNKEDIITGQNVLLAWEVDKADTVTLINQTDGSAKVLESSAGSLDTGALDRETTYLLEAKNAYIATPVRSNPLRIKVSTPTPTLQPTPSLVRFFANPPAVVAGESTTLQWEVTGVDVVSVQGVGPSLPAAHSVMQWPQQTTDYVLNAGSGSTALEPQIVTVWVTPAPTLTPMPEAPKIVFFSADPTTLIQGKAKVTEDQKQVELKWLVEGKVTNVELNGGPDVGIFSNLDPESSVNLTIAKNTIFVLTAFNEDATSSQTIQVEVLAATPTPTLTPTPAPTGTPVPSATPLPTVTPTPTTAPASITSFVISSPGSPRVTDLGGTNPHLYKVQVNTDAIFSWVVENAVTVTFFPADGSSSEVGTSGQTNATITGSGIKNYSLVAENSVGERTTAQVIQITVVDQDPPDPPFNITGVETENEQNTINWVWSADQDKNEATGFRVYRANVGSTFSLVVDENTLGADTRSWTDTLSATCGKAYYVVAVYEDISGSTQESAISTNSWYSQPCS
jgi:hypothetical protein